MIFKITDQYPGNPFGHWQKKYDTIHPGKYVLTKNEHTDACSAFSAAYSVSGHGGDFHDNFSIDSVALKNIIDYVKGQMIGHENNHGISRIGFKFIHRYNIVTRNWYLCMVILKINIGDDETINDIKNNEYDLVNPVLTPGGHAGYNIISTGPIAETNDVNEQHASYFDNFLYGGLVLSTPYVGNKCVKYSVFSFQEVLQLFADNGIDFNDVGAIYNVRMEFSSCSFDNPNSGELRWPHAITINLNRAGVSLITNHTILSSAALKNAAADYGTMHPPKSADKYIFPDEIT